MWHLLSPQLAIIGSSHITEARRVRAALKESHRAKLT
jgi:hypothetical protein